MQLKFLNKIRKLFVSATRRKVIGPGKVLFFLWGLHAHLVIRDALFKLLGYFKEKTERYKQVLYHFINSLLTTLVRLRAIVG